MKRKNKTADKKKYYRNYYKENKEVLDKKVKDFKKREIKELSKSYIINVLTKYGKYERSDITPYLIRKKREQIKKIREIKSRSSSSNKPA